MCVPIEEVPDVRRIAPRKQIFNQTFDWRLASGHIIRIPKGFICDGASIPRLADPLVAPSDLSEAAWGTHDFLYPRGGRFICPHCDQTVQMTRAEVDRLFHEINIRHKVPRRRAWYAYIGVRAGGWRSFRD